MLNWIRRLFQSPEMKQLVWYVAELSWKVAQLELQPKAPEPK